MISIGLLESAQESFVGVTRDLRTICFEIPSFVVVVPLERRNAPRVL